MLFLGLDPAAMTPGRMTYELRRLRLHGLIERVPDSHRYRVTDLGMATAICLTRVHNRLIRTGLAQLTDTDPPMTTRCAPPWTDSTRRSTGSRKHHAWRRDQPG